MFYGSLLERSGDTAPVPAPSRPAPAWETYAVRHDIERLLMITEALWGILKEQHGYTDAELFRRVMAIDLRDGRADGRVAPTPARECPHCHRPMTKGRPVCIFCGRASMMDLFER